MALLVRLLAALTIVVSYTDKCAWAEGSSMRPKSSYCDTVCSQLKTQWKPAPEFEEPATFDVRIDTNGNIKQVETNSAVFFKSISFKNLRVGNVQLLAGPKGSAAAQHAGKQFLWGKKKLDAPPSILQAPIWLRVSLSNKPEQFSVACRDPELVHWLTKMEKRIGRNWYPPKCPPEVKPIVGFTVHQDGSITNANVAKEGSMAISDQAALRAVTQAAPFSPLPDGTPSAIDLQQTFNY